MSIFSVAVQARIFKLDACIQMVNELLYHRLVAFIHFTIPNLEFRNS